MNSPLKQLKKLKMGTDAKKTIRDRLVFIMDTTERNEPEGRLLWQKQTPLLSLITLNGKLPMPVIGILVALMLGTGTAFAAEAALPGETLYPVKIYVNEEIREALSIRAEKKAEWELERAHRRAQEALKAQEQGKLDEALRARMVQRMREYEAKAQDLTTQLETSGDLQAAAHMRERMENYLEAKVNVFEEVGVSDEELREARVRREEYQKQLERRRELLQDQPKEQPDRIERRREALQKQAE